MELRERIGGALTKVFKTSSVRYVKKCQSFVEAVNALEAKMAGLTDEQLRGCTERFRAEIRARQAQLIGEDLRAKLREIGRLPEEARRPAKRRLTELLQECAAEILPEAFAVVREASDRQLGVRNVFDSQLGFDPSTLSPENRRVFDEVKARVDSGEDVHRIDLPPGFYAEIRRMYDANERPPFRFRHFDVQLIGGLALYEGRIAEMATGEGKTLVATLAAYAVALTGRKVHVITVNDYLAQRDRDWMAPVHEMLGLTVGAIQSDMDTAGDQRRAQYGCDITYGTNNEFGFDYLRDNMKVRVQDQVQGPLDYAIVDEVDSILIDEARTPLIISGPAHDDTTRYQRGDKVARDLMRLQKPRADIERRIDQTKRKIANTEGEVSDSKKAKDDARVGNAQSELNSLRHELANLEAELERTTQYYEVEYDRRSVHLTHEGIGAAQEIAGVGSFYVGSNMEWPHLLEQSLRAHVVYEKEKEYVVQDDQVIIVDEFTGRLMHGRQWSDGLHQAVEAKEGVRIKEESQTLATITIQNFFKLYQQLAGMTGTAMTEADEFMKIYQLDVVAIPTNKPVVRDDREDLIYKSQAEKLSAMIEDIYETSKAGRPVLVGTTSIEKNELVSSLLTKKYGLDHEVLNAKHHAREAAIVAKAGQQHKRRDGQSWGNVTIATNMAGRGTDIKLAPQVVSAGGLHVIGTERHEARRIDNQLRGRSGRQGDPGSSQFFLCFDDDLMRIFAPEWTVKALGWIGWQEGEPIYHSRISKGVEKAQKKVEQRNFEIRKSLLEYDEVMDYQRQVFFTRRQAILEGVGLEGLIWEMIDEVVAENCRTTLDRDYPYQCIAEWARTVAGVDLEVERLRGSEPGDIESLIRDRARNNAEQEITITLGEYMSDDMPAEEWDLRGLSKWAMSKFSVNVSQNQLRKMTPDDVEAQLIEAAGEQVGKLDLARITSFLEEDFGARSLADWVEGKFAFRVDPAELAVPWEQAHERLIDRARQAYRRREIEYPVDFILNVSLRRQEDGSADAAVQIAAWARRKYNAELGVEEIQHLSFDKLRSRLIEMGERYADGELTREIREALDRNGRQPQPLAAWARQRYGIELTPDELEGDGEAVSEKLEQRARAFLRSELTDLERFVLLRIYDQSWKDHLYTMDHLKSSVGLRGFAERDPKLEYKKEGFRLFQEMLSSIREKVTDMIFKARLESQQRMRNVWNISAASHDQFERFAAQQQAAQGPQGEAAVAVKTIKVEGPRVGRNDPCPCGSGKKYKKCCGRMA